MSLIKNNITLTLLIVFNCAAMLSYVIKTIH